MICNVFIINVDKGFTFSSIWSKKKVHNIASKIQLTMTEKNVVFRGITVRNICDEHMDWYPALGFGNFVIASCQKKS